MALRRIAKIGEAVLRKKSKVVDEVNDKIRTLIDDMSDTMYEADGVGLAAPQVGILKRVIVVDTGEGLIELVNPVILDASGEQTDEEGCLSVEGESGVVTRPYRVVVEGLDRNGVTRTISANGFMARALCHEIDHLDGILYVDKIEN
ncbi:MAG: peptide deformylase [Clostridioides sp.]|jgi:peptide deformylase|nr:peptide deformylase [Clostridioides sp.]